MHTRRFATLLLGMWLAGTLFMMGVAFQNLNRVDKLLKSPGPEATQYIKILGANSARTLLRYQVSELNRFYYEHWELGQLCIGTAVGLTLLFATNGDKYYMAGVGLLLLLVIVEHWLITPQLLSFGRAIDFVPPEAPSAERIKFWRFQNAYTVLEAAKLVLLGAISARLLMIRSRRRSRPRNHLDVVHDSNHAAIDG